MYDSVSTEFLRFVKVEFVIGWVGPGSPGASDRKINEMILIATFLEG